MHAFLFLFITEGSIKGLMLERAAKELSLDQLVILGRSAVGENYVFSRFGLVHFFCVAVNDFSFPTAANKEEFLEIIIWGVERIKG